MSSDAYDFELAATLFDAKNYAELWRYALVHANAGNSKAQCLMGFLCEHGFGGPSDLDEAKRWLHKAADQNDAVAWNNLGTFWAARGEKAKSKQRYQKAVELGFTMAAPLAE